jgi:hypothetical protein
VKTFLFVATIALAYAGAAVRAERDDLTALDRERVRAITAPTQDFSKA